MWFSYRTQFTPIQILTLSSTEIQAMVDVAREVGADAVSHGCTGKGNDQARISKLNINSFIAIAISRIQLDDI